MRYHTNHLKGHTMAEPICRPKGIERPQWATRGEEESRRDGWLYAGTGQGLRKYIWHNSRFEGEPEEAGLGGPWNYGLGGCGCPVPGAVRWVGKYYAGPILSQGIFFQMALRINTGICRLFLDGKLVAGHQTDEWAAENGCADKPPWEREIVGRSVVAGHEKEFLEIFTSTMNLPADQPVSMVYEYAIEEGQCQFGSKNANPKERGTKEGADRPYSWMEILSEDFCYAD